MKRFLLSSSILLSQLAHGAIVAQVFDTPLPGDFDFQTIRTFYDLDLNSDGVSDFWVISNGGIVELLPFGSNRIFSVVSFSEQRSVRNLSEGTLIGPVSPDANPRFTGIEDSQISFDEGESFIYLCLAQFGGSTRCSSTLPIDPEERTHYGLEFDIEGEIHYGWVQVSAPENLSGLLEIHGWGYETVSGEPIAAGAIPEPSTIGLTALSLAGLAFRRKRNEVRLRSLKALPMKQTSLPSWMTLRELSKNRLSHCLA